MRGRPVGGVLKVALSRVQAMPAVGTMSEVAKQLGVSYPTVRMWSLVGGLPFFRDGSVFVVNRDELETWLRRTGRLGL